MIERIKKLSDEIGSLTAGSPDEAEQLRLKYLSKKGLVSVLFDEFKTVPADLKREVGQRLNELKSKAQDHIEQL